MFLARYTVTSSYLLANLFLTASPFTAGLQSNAHGFPQVLFADSDVCSNVDQCVCHSREPCQVQLDVPNACINVTDTSVSNVMSTCPIVFFLHGAGGTINGFAQNSGVHDASVIGVYPQGMNGWNTGPKSTNACAWDNYDCTTDPNEGAFILDIINKLRDLGAYGNVYVHGSSNGAALAFRLAANADEIPIKGIISKKRQMLKDPLRSGPGGLNYNQPQGDQRVSVLNIMGTNDGLIPYEGGSSSAFGGDTAFKLYNALESNEFWASQNGCQTEPVVLAVSCDLCTDGVADFYRYPNCADGTIVEHYKVYGGTHSNAGQAVLGGQTESEVVFDFIERCETGTGLTVPTNPSPVPLVPSPTASVVSPLSAPTCVDDSNWHGNFLEDHNCAYVALNPSVRCSWINPDNVEAYYGCPATCGSCNDFRTSAPIALTTSSSGPPVPATTTPTASPGGSPPCVDDPNWHTSYSENHNCAYVALFSSERCGWVSDDDIEAYDGCSATCGDCNDDTTSALSVSTTASSGPPVLAPTAPVASPVGLPPCVDDSNWKGFFSEDHNCAYVALDPSERCSWVSDHDVEAYDGCLATCSSCNDGTILAPSVPTAVLPCQHWCVGNMHGWPTKCQWVSHCSGCAGCTGSPTPVPVQGGICKYYCVTLTNEWTMKCNWQLSCSGCDECAS